MENHRRLNHICFLCFILALAPTQALAVESRVLQGPQIIALLEGKTLKGVYADGTPVRESYAVGGKIPDYLDSRQSATGTWSVVNNQLCTFYNADMAGGCFRVEMIGTNCFDYFAIASSVEEALKPTAKPRYTARASIEGLPDTCPDELSV
jgi:hypothetical protein